MTCILLGFCCLVAWRLAEFIKALPLQRGPIRRPQPVAQPSTTSAKAEPLPKEPIMCSQCGVGKIVEGKPCDFCEYERPSPRRYGRQSFAAIKRRVENQIIPERKPQ